MSSSSIVATGPILAARDGPVAPPEALTMTLWRRVVVLAGVGCLIAGAALAQQTMPPPNQPRKLEPPNTPLEEPSHRGPPLEQPKEPKRETTTPRPLPKPPTAPKPPADANEQAVRGERPPPR